MKSNAHILCAFQNYNFNVIKLLYCKFAMIIKQANLEINKALNNSKFTVLKQLNLLNLKS